ATLPSVVLMHHGGMRMHRSRALGKRPRNFRAFCCLSLQKASLYWAPPARPPGQRTRSGLRPGKRRLKRGLFYFDRRAGLGELLLDGLGFFLVHAFLDRLGSAIDEVLRLLQTEAGDLADSLDDVDLVRAHCRQHYAELGLLFSGSGSPGSSCSHPGYRDRSGGGG